MKFKFSLKSSSKENKKEDKEETKQEKEPKAKKEPTLEETIGEYLYSFYDYWSNGFSKKIFSEDLDRDLDGNYSRQDFLTEFLTENSGIYVCPICDGTAYYTRSLKEEKQAFVEHVYASVDHFFPRSIYPHLSCHPRNLIPICAACNSGIKGTINPLAEANTTLADLILPYGEINFYEHAWIELNTSRKWKEKKETSGSNTTEKTKKDSTKLAKSSAVTEENPENSNNENNQSSENRGASQDETTESHITVTFKPSLSNTDNNTSNNKNIKLTQIQLENLNQIYKVEERWNLAIEQAEEQAFRRICQFLALDIYPPLKKATESNNNVGSSENWEDFLATRLKPLIGLIYKNSAGKDPYAILELWLLNNFLVNAKEPYGLALVSALRGWVKDHNYNLEELTKVTDDLQNRSKPTQNPKVYETS